MNEWEFSYNGLTFGGATDYALRFIDGLDMPDSREDLVTRMDSHGAFVFAQYLAERRITIEGDIVGDPGVDLASKINIWRQVFNPQPVAIPLSFVLPGEIQKRIYCVPTRRDLPNDFDFNIGIGRFTIELVAEDPRIYEDNLNTASAQPATANGVDFDIDFSFNFGGGVGGQVPCTNVGTYFSPMTIRFAGPCTDPKATNLFTGEYLKLNTTIAAGEYIDVDVLTRTIVLNESASRYGTLDLTSTWWELPPGTTLVGFVATGTDSNTLMTVTWRGAWV